MVETSGDPRPRAFTPEMKRGTEPPPTPGWDLGPERRIDDKMMKSAFAWAGIGIGAAAGAKVVSSLRDRHSGSEKSGSK